MTILEKLKEHRNEEITVTAEELSQVIQKIEEYFMERLNEQIDDKYILAYIWWKEDGKMVISDNTPKKVMDELEAELGLSSILKGLTEDIKSTKKREDYFEKIKAELQENGIQVEVDHTQNGSLEVCAEFEKM